MRFLKYMLAGIIFMLFAVACCVAAISLGELLTIYAIPFAIVGFVFCAIGFFRQDNSDCQKDEQTDKSDEDNSNSEFND